MVKTTSLACDFGRAPPPFSLRGTDGKTHTLESCRRENGLLVMFICNHCPYVKAIRAKIIRDALELAQYKIGSVAIMSNDPTDYQEDSFENMARVATEYRFPFPYLYDETQQVAKDYGAVSTPDFFAYNHDLQLQYRGRLDDSGMHDDPDARRDLFVALKQISETGQGPEKQQPSIGCSIKWSR